MIINTWRRFSDLSVGKSQTKKNRPVLAFPGDLTKKPELVK
jgi:hypothetical protein